MLVDIIRATALLTLFKKQKIIFMSICQTFTSIKCRINFDIVCSFQFLMLKGDFLMQQMFIEQYDRYCVEYGVNSDHILRKTLDFLGNTESGWHHSALW